MPDKLSYIDPLKYKFDFGKYKGKPFAVVAKNDPQYVLWCHKVVKWFRLEKSVYQKLNKYRLKKSFLRGLELTPATEHALEVHGSDATFR